MEDNTIGSFYVIYSMSSLIMNLAIDAQICAYIQW